MKILYLDCSMGAAGDMLMAALWELLEEEERDRFVKQMNGLGLPGLELVPERSSRGGVAGTHMRVSIHGREEDGALPPAGEDGRGYVHHGSHHPHRSLEEIVTLIRTLPLPERVRERAAAVYSLLAEAEGKVHGCEAAQVHFHEAGALDAIADVTGVCWLMDRLSPDRIVCSQVHVGSGTVRCAHGVLSVPAPAAAELLRGIPSYSGEVDGELCTPTGAALLRTFAGEFGPQPSMTVTGLGYGLGSREFDRPNCLRAFWGESSGSAETVWELSCNLDDMTPEELGYAQKQLWKGGALDVWTVSLGMKKDRPGVQLCCLCRPEEREALCNLMLRHSSSWGVRMHEMQRRILERRWESAATPWGTVRVKCSGDKWKAEYEDAAALAEAAEIPLRRVLDAVAAKMGEER